LYQPFDCSYAKEKKGHPEEPVPIGELFRENVPLDWKKVFSGHPETRNFVLNRGALANVTAGIYLLFGLLNLIAQQRVRGK
jgi:hypothetical protein